MTPGLGSCLSKTTNIALCIRYYGIHGVADTEAQIGNTPKVWDAEENFGHVTIDDGLAITFVDQAYEKTNDVEPEKSNKPGSKKRCFLENERLISGGHFQQSLTLLKRL